VNLTARCLMKPPIQLIPKLLFELNQLNCKHTFGNLELEDDALVYRLSSYLPDDPDTAGKILEKLLKEFLAQAMINRLGEETYSVKPEGRHRDVFAAWSHLLPPERYYRFGD